MKYNIKNLDKNNFVYRILDLHRKGAKKIDLIQPIFWYVLDIQYKKTVNHFKYGFESMSDVPTKDSSNLVFELVGCINRISPIFKVDEIELIISQVNKSLSSNVLSKIKAKIDKTTKDEKGQLREAALLQELMNEKGVYKNLKRSSAIKEFNHVTILSPNKHFKISILLSYQRKIVIQSIKSGEVIEIGGLVSTTTLKQVYETFNKFALNCPIPDERPFMLDLSDIIHKSLTSRV